MAKSKTSYVCTDCGAETPRWAGRCPHCQAWNTIVETVVDKAAEANSNNRFNAWVEGSGQAVDLSSVKGQNLSRFSSGIDEFDRVLGGGIVAGSVVLIGGDPGIGKSTLLLQVLNSVGQSRKVLYCTGEESLQQVALRAERLGHTSTSMRALAEIEVEKALQVIGREAPAVVVIDSIQTMYSTQLSSAPGTVAQVRECAAQLTRFAKGQNIALFLVGHVTKEGSLAGPRVLEHIVDTVLYFEGEQGSPFRMIRGLKNRFGSINELGVFSMGDQGLEEVSNPSSLFLTAHEKPVPGCCVLAALEGNRPFLVEVQALVEDSPTTNAKRSASGIDTGRLQMLLAVLNKHAGLTAFDQNVYVKIVGGVKLTEPAADLPVMLAAYSSLTAKPIPSDVVVFGEVGLAGELRAVQDADTRLAEAAKLGFKKAVIPAKCHLKKKHEGLIIKQVTRVDEALKELKNL